MSVLVAGIGNIFLGDDGFGPEVVRRLQAEGSPTKGVRIVDYGIRGMFLAFDLLGVDRLILVDALPTSDAPGAPGLPGSVGSPGSPVSAGGGSLGDGEPGEIVVLEIGPDDIEPAGFDAHAMSPSIVLGAVHRLGETLPPTYLVGCRVDTAFEDIGLTPRVEAAIPRAIEAVHTLVDRCLAELPPPPDGPDPRWSPVARIFRETPPEPKGPIFPSGRP